METWKITFLPFNQSLVLHEGFLGSDALGRAHPPSVEGGGRDFPPRSALREQLPVQKMYSKEPQSTWRKSGKLKWVTKVGFRGEPVRQCSEMGSEKSYPRFGFPSVHQGELVHSFFRQ